MYLRGSSFGVDQRAANYAAGYLKRLKYYAANGFTIVLHNLEFVYAVLYDLFNQRHSLEESALQFCNVTYEDYKDVLKIDSAFRVVLLKDEASLFVAPEAIEKELPSPLMNRFEKHILGLRHVTPQSSYLTRLRAGQSQGHQATPQDLFRFEVIREE